MSLQVPPKPLHANCLGGDSWDVNNDIHLLFIRLSAGALVLLPLTSRLPIGQDSTC